MAEKAARKPQTKAPKTKDEELDEALDQSFPASDPPAQTAPTHIGAKKKHEKKQG